MFYEDIHSCKIKKCNKHNLQKSHEFYKLTSIFKNFEHPKNQNEAHNQSNFTYFANFVRLFTTNPQFSHVLSKRANSHFDTYFKILYSCKSTHLQIVYLPIILPAALNPETFTLNILIQQKFRIYQEYLIPRK